MNKDNTPEVRYFYKVSDKPIVIQEPKYEGSRKVRTLPRSILITAGLSYIDGLHVLIDGRAVRADGEFSERGQSTVGYRDNAEHWSEDMEEAPYWAQEIIAQVREFERKRLA